MAYEYKRISGLTEKAQLGSDDVFAVDNADNVASQKVSYSTLRAQLASFFNLGTLTSGHYIQGHTFAGDLAALDTEEYNQQLLIGTIFTDLAPVQIGVTATRAYAEGSFLVYNNQMYMVSANIAAGSTMLVGTNILPVTVGSAIMTATLALAPSYDVNANYDVGDIVTHVGGLYVCLTASSGAWNSERWNAVTVADLITALAGDLDDVQGAVGTLADLTTTTKTDLVAAINEVDSEAAAAQSTASSANTKIGTLSNLNTTAKNNLVAAVNEINSKCTAIGIKNVIEVTTPSFSSLPKTFNAAGITADHELVQDGYAYVSVPSAMGADWSITTGAGTITISGTFSGSTAAYVKATFGVKNKVTATS